MMDRTTIAAIASGITASGIGVIRVSGPKSIRVAERIFISADGKKLSDAAGYTMHYGHITANGETIDEAVALVFRAPKSFTGEDVVEFDTHGGMFVMQRVLSLLVEHGAAMAAPGEFTKRAFLNGKLDLSQAESVMNLIASSNEQALKASVGQLSGKLSEKIKALREALLHEIAFMEAALDDPEHYSLDGYGETLRSVLENVSAGILSLVDTYSYGRILNDGIKTVIIGSPNVGKSSLMNALLGHDRAIVTETAGTTRDTLSERVNVKGLTLHIIDTAGIREHASDKIEEIGIARAKESIADADLVLLVLDGTRALSAEEDAIFTLLSEKMDALQVIALVNKADLALGIDMDALQTRFGDRFLTICAKQGEGIEELRNLIFSLFHSGALSYNEEVIITNLRHFELLRAAQEKMALVMESLENGISEDFISADLTLVYQDLGFIIGEAVGDDVVDKVFSEFCMGK